MVGRSAPPADAFAPDSSGESDTTSALHQDDAPVGEQIIAGVIRDTPGPIVREEDGFDGRGQEHAQAVAQAHVYCSVS